MSARMTHLQELESFFGDFFAKTPFRISAEMSAYHFKTGGKRLRAMLPMQIFEISGRKAAEALPLGAAVEMIHNATLVHDDLQDGDEVRRGLPTVWKKYSEAQAINCGDAMFQYAFQILSMLKVDAEKKATLFGRAAQATLEVIEGQAQEFIMKDEEYPTLERYLGVIGGKTSGLFAFSVSSALYCLGLDEEYCKVASKAAWDLGLLFQIQDDVLDIYGQKGRDRRATDVAEGKVSFFVAHVNAVAGSADRQELREILRKPREKTSDADIERAISIFEKHGAKQAAFAMIQKIQSDVAKNAVLAKNGRIHSFLSSLADLFLEPINGIR